MKILISILLISVSFAQLKINIGTLISINNAEKVSIPLSCLGSIGKVTYQVKSLPRGLSFQNGIIEGKSQALLGYYPVLISAEDEARNSGSQLVVFKVVPIPKPPEAKPNSTTQNKTQNNQTIQKKKQTVDQPPLLRKQEKINKQGENVSLKVVPSPKNSQEEIKKEFIQLQNQQRKQQVQQINKISTNSNESLKMKQHQKQLAITEPGKTSKGIQVLQKKGLNSINSVKNVSLSLQPPQSIQSILNKYAPLQIIDVEASSFKSKKQLVQNSNQAPKYIPLFFSTKTDKQRKSLSESLKSSEILTRQMNANKQIAAILNTIDQLSSSLNSTRNNIPLLELNLKNATNSLKLTQLNVYKAETQRSRLKIALNTLNKKQQNIKKELAELEEKVRIKKQEEIRKKKKVQHSWQEVKRLQQILKQAQLSSSKAKESTLTFQKQAKMIQLQIDNIDTEIQNVKKEIKNISELDSHIEKASKMIKQSDEQIKDLKQKLNAAVDRKNMAQKQQKRLKFLKENTPRILSQLEHQKIRKNAELKIFADKMAALSNELANITLVFDNTNLSITKLRNQSLEIQIDLNVISGNIQYYQELIGKKQNDSEEVSRNSQMLNNQIQSYDSALQVAFEDNNESNLQVQRAKQSLNLFIKKWQNERKMLKNENEKLEKVKKQKERADRDMQQLMKQKSGQITFQKIDNQRQIIYPGVLDGTEESKQKIEDKKPIQKESNGNLNLKIIEDIKKT